MTDTIETVARAIEKELDRDFEAWVARWTYPGGSYTDAPEPPTSKYTTSPEKIARAAMRAHLEALMEPSEEVLNCLNDAFGGSDEQLLPAWKVAIEAATAELDSE